MCISQYHHFQFDSSTPGIVHVKEHCDATDTQIKIVKDDVTIDVIEMPEIITPPGMSLDRQKYLYEKIRPYCANAIAAELTCPRPLLLKTIPTLRNKNLKENVVIAENMDTLKQSEVSSLALNYFEYLLIMWGCNDY